MVFLYNILIKLYSITITLASGFNAKARLWVNGRKSIFNKLKQAFHNNSQPVIWMHCASLGEFEQGRPVLEALKKEYPTHKILLTFFSPSGYEVRKNYSGADWIFYLPIDTKHNATTFLQTVKPALAIFVKYEYWYNHLIMLHKRHLPVILISAIFRKNSIFFKTYGKLHRNMLNFFSHVFVQDEASKTLISTIIPANKITVAGDTRFDRVVAIADQFEPIGPIEKFIQNRELIVAGSTWPDDEKNLWKLFNLNENKYSLIIAPHEINSDHINFLKILFPTSVLYSQLNSESNKYKTSNEKFVLIIDNIGMLSRLYNYSTISYIGGGFNKSGIHNTLEAAVYGKPIIFGPNYEKFAEAINLIKIKGGYSYSTDNELINIIKMFNNKDTERAESGKRAGDFVKLNKGATAVILHYIRKIFF